jgi:hypothetical protein
MRFTLNQLTGAASLIFLLSVFAIAQGKIYINAAPYSAKETAEIWVDLRTFRGVTSLQVKNFTSKEDKYDEKFLSASEAQDVVPLEVNIVKKDGSPNRYFIDAYTQQGRVSESFFANSSEVTILYYEKPPGSSGGGPSPQPPNTGSTGVVTNASQGSAGSAVSKDDKLVIVVNEDAKKLSDPRISMTLSSPNDWPKDAFSFLVRNSVSDQVFETNFPLRKEKAPSTTFEKDQKIIVKLHRGKNIITVAVVKADNSTVIEGFRKQVELNCGVACGDTARTARAVVGFEQIGASSSESKMSPFLDLFFDAPLGRGTRPLSLWSQIRLSSIPIQTLVNIGTLNGFSGILTDSKLTPNELTQSFDFTFGLEKRITHFGKLSNGFLPGRTSVSLIAGVGAINPLTYNKTAQIYKVPAGIDKICKVPENGNPFCDLFPDAIGKTNIAFVGPNRIRFYRQYFGGFRFRTNFFDDDGMTRTDIFPALVDITAGQSEAITGRLQGVILRAQGSTPLPILGDFLSIVGSLQMRMGKNRNQPLLFLEPADAKASLFDSSTFIVPIDKNPNTISNRDTFKLGIGIDLYKLFKPDSKP